MTFKLYRTVNNLCYVVSEMSLMITVLGLESEKLFVYSIPEVTIVEAFLSSAQCYNLWIFR